MTQERRRFFRIEDIVEMKAEVVDHSQAESRIEAFWEDPHQFSLRNEFNYKLEQHQGDLNHIKRNMPELGRYLEMLQQQIDLLTDHLIDNDDSSEHIEREVNLSAQGLSFTSDQPANSNDIIELHLKLMPSRQQVVIFCRVINCEKMDSDPVQYRIALDFEHIHEADREILVKHVHGKQLRALGAARYEEDED